MITLLDSISKIEAMKAELFINWASVIVTWDLDLLVIIPKAPFPDDHPIKELFLISKDASSTVVMNDLVDDKIFLKLLFSK